ncbi:hypothetical protein MWU58_06500 [Flavobacteriaceae bacterium S0825]|uniref:hypothetical protein n=1 Tax=Gaetbulibacter sp. S0825 TaxID=2720084 RepID=UPI001430EC04|nr:hypothetical protein [Gaetbulibacter sp. S0825]MCK0108935.1 hypothetical protein [Flavobacteriaceae bacterium S0825]NIX64570.1 hypothetical protein [Gaetbulibacter sp. S0825]
MSKKDKIDKKIKNHYENKLYARIKRGIKHDFEEILRGYIIKISNDFILVKEESDFQFVGYHIIPRNTIKGIRFNDNDKYYDFINKSEHKGSEFEIDQDSNVDLTSWETIFSSLKKKNISIISECEKFKDRLFCIGPIVSISKKAVYLEYFNAQGIIDSEPVEHKFKWITKITYNDNYSKTFSKYKRKKE